VCGQLGGGFSGADPPWIGRRMITNPDNLSCATRRSATILDIVSAACDRTIALPLVRASANAISKSRGSAGVSFSSGSVYAEGSGTVRTKQEHRTTAPSDPDDPLPAVGEALTGLGEPYERR
jgi:hypothetical protein